MDPVTSPQPNGSGGEGGTHSPLVHTTTTLPPDDPPPRQPILDRFLHLIREHNPFYLLSAASMLGGCLLMTNSLSWNPIGLTKLLVLLGTLNLYEILLLALGLLLIRLNGNALRKRDAAQLLVLAFVFLCDAAFLVSEVVSTRLALGSVLSVILFLAALAKIALVLRLTRLRVTRSELAVSASLLAILFALPCALKSIGDYWVTGGHLYLAWWLAAGLYLLHDVVSRRSPAPATDDRRLLPPAILLVFIPFLSLLTHIGILHYVYDRPFTAAHATPALLILALVLFRLPMPKTKEWIQAKATLQATLLLSALLLSMVGRHDLLSHIPVAHLLSPWILGLAATYLLTFYLYKPRLLLPASIAGTLATLAYTLGPSRSDLATAGTSLWINLIRGSAALWQLLAQLASALWNLIPSTPTQWGVTAVTTSFLLLGIGAIISLKHRRPPDIDPHSPPAA
jgi:hypothetical protein